MPRPERKELLRAGLRRVSEQFISPSSTAYLPFGNCNHRCAHAIFRTDRRVLYGVFFILVCRIVRIHDEMSFTFATKARVPCYVVFEVVDDSAASQTDDLLRYDMCRCVFMIAIGWGSLMP